MKVLIVRLSALGDVVMTLPLAADLARAGHEVHWLVNAAYAPLVTACTAVSRVHAWQGLSGATATVAALRREQFAAVIDAQGLWKSALPAKCAGGRLVGLDLPREPVAWLYDERLPAAGWDEHALLRYRRLGTAFGTDRSTPPQYGVTGAPREGVTAKLAALCPGNGPLLVANPNARWASKRWPAAAWAALLRQFPQARRLLIGSADEHAATQAIADAVPGATFEGEIQSINSKVEESTRNIQVRAIFKNPEHKLLPGMFAHIVSVVGAPQKQLTLPQTAITFNPYGNTVYVVAKDKDGKLIAVQSFVETGKMRGDQIAVIKGIKEGDEVVTSGQLKLRNGTPIIVTNEILPKDDPNPKPEDK